MKKAPDEFDLDAERLKKFERALMISKEELDDALETQPRLMYEVGEIVALQISRRDAAKTHLAEMEAEADADIRSSEEKVTEAQVKSLVRMSGTVSSATTKLNGLNLSVARWSNMKESIIQRGHALRELVNLYTANYYATAGVDVRRARERREERRRRA